MKGVWNAEVQVLYLAHAGETGNQLPLNSQVKHK